MTSEERREGEAALRDLTARANAWFDALPAEEREAFQKKHALERAQRLASTARSIGLLGSAFIFGAFLSHTFGMTGVWAAGAVFMVAGWLAEMYYARRVRELSA